MHFVSGFLCKKTSSSLFHCVLDRCLEVSHIIQAAIDLAIVSFEQSMPATQDLLHMVVFLNRILSEIPGILDNLKNSIALMCEKMFHLKYLSHDHELITFNTLIYLINKSLAPKAARDVNLLKKYMGGIMEDITNATYPQYRSLCAPNPSSLFLFVCCIARTNLEIELVQGGPLCEPLKKKSCFVPLMNVLHLHSKLLSHTIDKNQQMDYAVKVLNRMTGEIPRDHSSLTFFAVEVPLFLRDPIALLLQIILTLPTNLNKEHFKCVIQVLYNFLFIQSLVQVSCRLSNVRRIELGLNSVKYFKALEECCDHEKCELMEVRS